MGRFRTNRPTATAFAAVLVAALFWGLGGTAAEVLFQRFGFSPAWLVGVRMTGAALILLPLIRPRIGREDLGPLIVFGLVGLGVVQFSYYMAIAASNVATATFLQYLAPAMYAVFAVGVTRVLPRAVTVVAICLAVTGTFALVFSGAAADLTPAALWWGLLSAASMAFYSSYPRRLIGRVGPWATTTWGLLFGGLAFDLIHPVWSAPLAGAGLTAWGLVAFVVIFATLVPFGLYIYGLQTLPAAESMVLATFEPVAAAVAAIFFLGKIMSPAAYVGGLLVVAAVLLLALFFQSDAMESTEAKDSRGDLEELKDIVLPPSGSLGWREGRLFEHTLAPREDTLLIDLDHPPERRGTGAVKWDALKQVFGREDLIPLWVADMDFPSPPEIQDAMIERIRHGMFGYGMPGPSFYEAVQNWLERRHGWTVKREALFTASGVIASLAKAVDLLTHPGDGIVIQPPVYAPFRRTILDGGRRVVENPLQLVGDRYEMDLDDLERKLDDAAMLIVCNPHNPVGRLWSSAELRSLIDVAKRHGTVVVSDEIHGDIIRGEKPFTPLLSLPEASGIHGVSLFAPSKTFNLPGLRTSLVAIPDPDVRALFEGKDTASRFDHPNILGMVACETAYRHGEPWLERVLSYIRENSRLLEGRVRTRIPQIRVIPAQATYLQWLDARELHLDADSLSRFLREEARIAVEDGTIFGTGGAGFFRVNLATTHALLEEGLARLEAAVENLRVS